MKAVLGVLLAYAALVSALYLLMPAEWRQSGIAFGLAMPGACVAIHIVRHWRRNLPMKKGSGAG